MEGNGSDREGQGTGSAALSIYDIDLLEETANECDADTCIELLDAGANVNASDEDGCTPLIWAVLAGSEESVKLLIGRGADVNCKNNEGETPLHIAAMSGAAPIAKILLDHGADVDAEDDFGITPLRSAELNEDRQMVELLKQAKPS